MERRILGSWPDNVHSSTRDPIMWCFFFFFSNAQEYEEKHESICTNLPDMSDMIIIHAMKPQISAIIVINCIFMSKMARCYISFPMPVRAYDNVITSRTGSR